MPFTRVQPAGWGSGDKLTSAQLNTLDTDHANALDKRGGDTLAGTTIQSGGLILQSSGGSTPLISLVSGNASIAAQASGAVIQAGVAGAYVQATGAGKIRTTNGGRIELQDNDYPLLGAGHTGRSRTIVAPCRAMAGVYDSIVAPGSLQAATQPGISLPKYSTLGFVTSVASTGAYPFAYMADLTAYMHNGATLASATLTMFGAPGHAVIPASYPSFGIYRAGPGTLFGPAVIPQTYTMTPGTPSYAQLVYIGAVSGYNGTQQQFTFTPTANNVIDKATYSYFAVIWDECGAGAVAGTTYNSISLSFTNITDMRPS